uniref:DUF4283 domain-containing protein n=1 Tax=Nelumbo nucifera TaxID=4432 RepID=A0A822ZIV6_NELNU|nr:TPA_asm: hypothetical protein HUJ06_001186 [Nelumbo nucifera]
MGLDRRNKSVFEKGEYSKAKRCLNFGQHSDQTGDRRKPGPIPNNSSMTTKPVDLDQIRKGRKDESDRWSLCLIGKILGEPEPIKSISGRMMEWGLKGKMGVKSIGNGFFLISCASSDDYNIVPLCYGSKQA